MLEYFEVAKENARNEAAIEAFRQKIYEKIEDLKQHDDYYTIIELCNIIIYLKPNSIDAWQDKADAYFCLGQTQKSLETYRLALHQFAEDSQSFSSASSAMNRNPQTIEKEFSLMAESGIRSRNERHLQEAATRETQPLEEEKRMLKAISEKIRERAQFLGRLVKKRKEKT